ncbi:MAG: cytochrome c5 family protein [Burkholderiales bacterium]
MQARMFVLLIGLGAGTALAGEGKSGEQVYKAVCTACHATGVEKAPKFGDRKAWAPLIREGQHVLTAHAWVGVRGMPPRGGQPDLSLAEFARATAYMARAAGGKWQDPDAKMLAGIRTEVRKREGRSGSGKP